MQPSNIFVHKTGLEKYFAKAISNRLEENKDKNILLLLSGGSSLKVLDYVDQKVLGKNITITLLDERFTTNTEISNFLQLTKTDFYKKAKEEGVTFISAVCKDGESLEEASKRWENALRRWKESSLGDSLVIAIMGIGTDGHSAGIMPFPEDQNIFSDLFEKDEKWIVGYDAGNKNEFPLRMTATISFLKRMVDYGFMYASGEGKKEILKTILRTDEVAKYPASVIHKMKNVELHTDTEL